jgi:hypothetical protein
MECDMPESSGKSKVDKLDEAFLFLISLTSIIFMVIQAFSGGITFILYSIPLLVFGIVMPFYYGYWKGALEDSAIMRVRGWTYLFSGTVGYVTYMILFYAVISLNLLIIMIGVIIHLLFIYIFINTERYILHYIFEICNKEVSEFDLSISSRTMSAAESFLIPLLTFVLSPNFVASYSLSSIDIIISLLLFFPLPIHGIFSELYCQRILKSYERLYCEIVFWKRLLKNHGRFIKALSRLLDSLTIVIFISILLISTFFKLKRNLLYISVALWLLIFDLRSLVQNLSYQETVYKWRTFEQQSS